MMWILSLEFDVMSSMFGVLEVLDELRKQQSIGVPEMSQKSPPSWSRCSIYREISGQVLGRGRPKIVVGRQRPKEHGLQLSGFALDHLNIVTSHRS